VPDEHVDAAIAHGLDGIEAEPASEHGQALGNFALLFGQKLVAPIEGHAKGPVPGVVPAGGYGPCECRQLVTKSGGQLSETQRAKSAGCQLDRQWYPVESVADLHEGHDVILADVQVGPDCLGPVDQQLDRLDSSQSGWVP
jgi:hypothetical protein